MSTPDDPSFLARWSRRKRAEARGAAPALPPGDPSQPADRSIGDPADAALVDRPACAGAAMEGAEGHGAAETAPDLSDLPALETITAETDVSVFLRRHVPDDLRNAALRRAWSADPVISTFVEMADYAWDFNTPEGNPVYGPLSAAVDAGKMAADILGIGLPEKTASASLPNSEGSGSGEAQPAGAARPETVAAPSADPGGGDTVAGMRPDCASPTGVSLSPVAFEPPDASTGGASRDREPCDARSQDALPVSVPIPGRTHDFGHGGAFGAPAHGAPVPQGGRRRHGGALPDGDS